MTLKSFLIISLSWLSMTMQGQNIAFFGEAHYGTYFMQSLKEYQTPSAGYFIPMKVVDDFPGFVGYKVYGTVSITNNISIGLFAGLNSTGGKSSYADFSGYMSTTTTCRGMSYGGYGEFKMFEWRKVNFNAIALGGIVVSNVKVVNETQTVSREATINNYKSVNELISPGICLSRSIERFIIKCLVSYEINIAEDLTSDSGKTLYNGSESVQAQWDGARIGIAVGVKIHSNKVE